MNHKRTVNQVVASVAVAALASVTQADTIYVDDDTGTGPGNGTPGNPYCSIGTAIRAAADTDEIIVAPGTYKESLNLGGKAVRLHSSDGPGVTMIDGTGFLHVVQCVSGEGPDTILEGFTITGGNANGDGFPDNSGGGMLNNNSDPTVTNCVFIWNKAPSGGGMYNTNSSPTVTGCTFSWNESTSGGGMYNTNSNPTVTNCVLSWNEAPSGGGMYWNEATKGGGMYNTNSNPPVTNCVLSWNEATNGGGMYNTNSRPPMTGCVLSWNEATSGGGMYNTNSSPPVTGCTFSWNEATNGAEMYNTNSKPTVTNCTFSDN
jgi:hypothetical protein